MSFDTRAVSKRAFTAERKAKKNSNKNFHRTCSNRSAAFTSKFGEQAVCWKPTHVPIIRHHSLSVDSTNAPSRTFQIGGH